MRISILDAARNDLIEGFHFYEEKESGLGDYFLSSLYADIEGLKIYFGIHPKAYKSFHRVLAHRFPFAIYYTWDAETVLIRAVVDCRRKPSWIRKHVKNV